MNKPATYILAKTVVFLLTMILAVNVNAQKSKQANDLVIKKLELGYPSPGIPFYHFKADIELPQPAIIEVEAAVDGQVLRATDLRRESDIENLNRPPISERPPSGYSVSQDATSYKNFSVVGWVRWEPGQKYNIRISVLTKKSTHASKDDIMLTATRTVTAPQGVSVFSSDWKSYKSVVVSETAGINRTREPVEVLLAFYPDEAQQITRDIRVMSVDPHTYAVTEVPCQVYDVMEDLKEDDLGPDKEGKPTRTVPLWLPTVSARVAFLADISGKSSQVFLVYYNNPDAMDKIYHTDLRVQGEAPGLQIENDKLSIVLHPNSGHLDQITLKSRPDAPFYHRLETNGAMHWNPDIYVPPRAWTHTADWKPPRHVKTVAGAIIARSEVWDELERGTRGRCFRQI